MRPELCRLAPAFALLVAGTLFPATASRAGLGSYFQAQACPTLAEVTAAYDFTEGFVGIAKCESLCKKASDSCRGAIKAATSCQLAFASDWVAFDKAVDCSGLTGSDLKDCKASWSADLKAWHAQIKAERNGGLATCDAFLNHPNAGCLRRCSGI